MKHLQSQASAFLHSTCEISGLGLYKEKGQPLQLINAFESPVTANGKGLADSSLDKMKEHHTKLKEIWGIKPTVETWLMEDGLENFIKKLTDHVE